MSILTFRSSVFRLVSAAALVACGGADPSHEDSNQVPQDTTAEAIVASVHCSGSGCNGQWPDQSGCWNDGVAIEQLHFTPPGYWAGPNRPWVLKLWWSPTCKTNWAEVDATGVYDVRSQVLMHDTGRYKYVPLDVTNDEWGFRHWTKMYYAPNVQVSACGITSDGFGDSQMGCTGSH